MLVIGMHDLGGGEGRPAQNDRRQVRESGHDQGQGQSLVEICWIWLAMGVDGFSRFSITRTHSLETQSARIGKLFGTCS